MAIIPTSRSIISHDASVLVTILEELVSRERGWVNLMPEIPESVEVPVTPNALAVFSKRGPVVPMATWTAPTPNRKGVTEPTDIGLQHGTAKQAKLALAGTIGAIPDEWRILSDNPRRGLVVRPPAGTDLRDEADWILRALSTICIPPQTGNFLVFRFEP